MILGVGAQVAVRLVGGDSIIEGRVEVFYGGVWGTVCNTSFDDRDAVVVCHQMGFSRGVAVASGSRFGQGIGLTWINDLECSGTESQIQQCTFSGWGNNQCHHSRDVGVVCTGVGKGVASILYQKLWRSR